MKPINILLTTLCICASIYTNANAQPSNLKPLSENTIVCKSKDALDEFMRYASDGDKDSIKKKLFSTSKCTMVDAGLQYTLLDTSIMGAAKIKIYGDSTPSGRIAWTMKSAL